MFADHPTRWLPRSGIAVVGFHADVPSRDHLSLHQMVTGPVPQVIFQVCALLGTHVSPTLQGIVQELTVNALCHRDWSLPGAAVQIRLFPSRIEWFTPGGLPDGVTLDTWRIAPYARNPTLATLMHQARYGDGLGLGMNHVYQLLATAGMVPPMSTEEAGWLRVTVAYVRDRAVSVQSSTPDPVAAVPRVTERQQHILDLVQRHGPLFAHEIAAQIGAPQRSIQRDLHALVQRGDVLPLGATQSRRYQWAHSEPRADTAAR